MQFELNETLRFPDDLKKNNRNITIGGILIVSHCSNFARELKQLRLRFQLKGIHGFLLCLLVFRS